MATGESWSQERVVHHLESVEAAAEDVLSDRQQIVDLARKQSGLREARRALQSSTQRQRGPHKAAWIVTGNTFIKLPSDRVQQLLKTDGDELEREVGQLRDGLRRKVDTLHSLERRPELKGFGLKALSRDEMSAVRRVLGD